MGVDLDTNDATRVFNNDEEFPRRLRPGVLLANRYDIETPIGRGGMGSVYRARDLHFPNITKHVAVKEMINASDDESMRQTVVHNFEREANIVASLNHPSIPKIYDYFTEGASCYLVMEYVVGKDMETLIRESSTFIEEDRVIHWAVELCEVLQYLHSHSPDPIIFRDIKPSNIMINGYDHVVLVDFGIAKHFRVGQRGTMMGTEGYSPPEQYRGESTPLGDIYALGATLHHLLTRHDPQVEAPFTFADRPIRKFNPNVSSGLETVVNRALEYLPEDRYPSAVEMKQALLNITLSQTTSAPSLATRLLADKQAIRPVWTFDAEDEIRGTPCYHQGILYAGSLDSNLYALDAARGDFIWKFPTRGGIVGRPAVGEAFLFVGSEDRTLSMLSTISGKVVWVYKAAGKIRSSPAVCENYVFFGADDGHLHGVDVTSGRRLWAFETNAPVRSSPLVDDKQIYFGNESGDFFCLDIMAEVRWHFHARRAVTSSPVLADGIIYFGSVDSSLYAIDAKMGWEIWRYRMGKGTISSPCVARDYVLIGSADGCIYCVDRTSGREIWIFHTEHQVTGSPLVLDEQVYCGSVDGYFYCLDLETGRLIWKYNAGAPIIGSAVSAVDLICFGATNHRMYALPTI